MASLGRTGIPYADYGWPLVTGCSNAGPACLNCYAARYAATRGKHLPQYKELATKTRAFTTGGCSTWRYQWTGEVRFHPELLDAPLHTKKPGRVFTVPTGDLFHEGVGTYDLDRAFAVMASTPHLTYVIVTKRPERMHKYMGLEYLTKSSRGGKPWPLPNVTLLPSVWDQASADRVIPLLLDTPAAVRGVSLEPMLGPVDLHNEHGHERRYDYDWLTGENYRWDDGTPAPQPDGPKLDWVVLGGETGPGARGMQPEDALGVYRQCRDAGVPFYFKQWGAGGRPGLERSADRDDEDAIDALVMETTRELPAVTP